LKAEAFKTHVANFLTLCCCCHSREHVIAGRIPYDQMVYNVKTIKDFVNTATSFAWNDEDVETVRLSEDIFHALVSDDAWDLRDVSASGLLQGLLGASGSSGVSDFMQEFIRRREFVTTLQEDASMRMMLQETVLEHLSVHRRVRTARAWAYAFPDSNDDDNAETASIHIAVCSMIPVQVMEVLIEAGAQVESRDINGNTPLILLAYQCDLNSKAKISLLLNYNAKVHATNQNFDTAIHVAACFSDIDVMQMLLMNMDCRTSPSLLHWYNADFKSPLTLALHNRQHRDQGRAMVEKLIRAGGDPNQQLIDGKLITGKVCCFESFDVNDFTVEDACCVTLMKGCGTSTKICMPTHDMISFIDKNASNLPTKAMDFHHFLREVDGQTFMCEKMSGLYDFSVSVRYPANLGFGRTTYKVVFVFPDDVLPEVCTINVVKDLRTTLGHAIISAIGHDAREFHLLSPLLHKYCSPLMRCAEGRTAADMFSLQMQARDTSNARPSREMNKRLREMQNDVTEMQAYIHASPKKKQKPSSLLECLPEDILRGVMRVMDGGSMDETMDETMVVP
jgi:hypothetical protein